VVGRFEGPHLVCKIGEKAEATMLKGDQVPGENYRIGDRLRAYVSEVERRGTRVRVMISRGHEDFVRRLFELEVPEISDGVVELKAVAREPGHRTKIAVWSNDPNVDPVGACVGARGARVRMVVNELRGEKVDIVPFSEEPSEFVMKALSPAKVKEVRIDEQTGTAEVIVPDYQLSLAIGKEGQNARLAARLTGWRVDIKSETQLAEEEAYAGQEWAEGEWVENESGELVWKPAEGGEGVSAEQWQAGESPGEDEAAAPAEGAEATEAPAEAAEPAAETAEAAPETAEATPEATPEEPVAEEEAAGPSAESPT